MKRWIFGALALSALGYYFPKSGFSTHGLASASTSTTTMPPCQVWFSPSGGCTEAVVSAIATAKSSVWVLAYSFTSKPITAALCDAKRRGIDVRIVLDKSQRTEKHCDLSALRDAGIPYWFDGQHAIAHNKTISIDNQVVLTGSFNWTSSAESRNAENLLILRDETLAAAYINNWTLHQAHSEEP